MNGETVSTILRQARALLRAESLIAEIRLRALLRRTVASALAGLIAVFGLAMLDLAAYLALVPIWGGIWAAVAVAFGDFLVAVLIIIVGGRGASGPELTLATELRDQAMEAVELDVKHAFDGVTGLVRGPAQFASSASALVIALLNAFLKGRGGKT